MLLFPSPLPFGNLLLIPSPRRYQETVPVGAKSILHLMHMSRVGCLIILQLRTGNNMQGRCLTAHPLAGRLEHCDAIV